jgi:acyl-CoA synthetase (AMP-forming)/AMP-acid ligase II/acyl carrier protein
LVATGVTISFVPTPMAEILIDLEWPSHGVLRVMLTGGDVLHRRPPAGMPFALVNNYGVTEATVVSTSGIVSPGPATGAPGIGRAITGVHLHVLDEAGCPVTGGDAGELFIGGDGVAAGYVNRPSETRERFVADPRRADPGARLYRTGDRVRIDPDGEVHFLGRIDSQVQIRGHRVELDEVAAALTAHPAVEQCAVVAREGDEGELRIVAYVVAANGVAPDRSELREHLGAWLPQYMIPTTFVPIESLPVTANGKLDRDALPAPTRARLGSRPPTSALTSIERTVTAILEELLELDGVGRDDNFFELGGHSLMGAQLVARLEDRFEVEIELLTIFDHPTAAGIAAIIEAGGEQTTRWR